MPDPDNHRPLIRRRDQATLAILAALALGVLGATRIWPSLSGHWVDYDELPLNKATFVVDINRADEAELSLLPEVGPATARAIVEYRRRHGAFGSAEELLEVPRIGPQTLAAMRPHLGGFRRPADSAEPALLDPQ